MNYSTTQGGNLLVIAGVISMIIKATFKHDILPEQVVSILTAIGVCISWYGRWKKGDVTFGGFKKYR